MSGWTTISIETDNIEEIMAQAEKLYQINFEEELEKNHGGVQRTDNAVCFTLGGYGRVDEAETFLKDNSGHIKRAVLLSANDTSDSGGGDYYEKINGELVVMDSISGLQPEVGEDVGHFFWKAYGFRPGTSYFSSSSKLEVVEAPDNMVREIHHRITEELEENEDTQHTGYFVCSTCGEPFHYSHAESAGREESDIPLLDRVRTPEVLPASIGSLAGGSFVGIIYDENGRTSLFSQTPLYCSKTEAVAGEL